MIFFAVAFATGPPPFFPREFDPQKEVVNIHFIDMTTEYLGHGMDMTENHQRKIDMMNTVATKHGFEYNLSVTYSNMFDRPDTPRLLAMQNLEHVDVFISPGGFGNLAVNAIAPTLQVPVVASHGFAGLDGVPLSENLHWVTMGNKFHGDDVLRYIHLSYPESTKLVALCHPPEEVWCMLYKEKCDRFRYFFPDFTYLSYNETALSPEGLLQTLADMEADIVVFFGLRNAMAVAKTLYDKQFYFPHVIWSIVVPTKQEERKWCEYHVLLDPLPVQSDPHTNWEDNNNGIGLFQTKQGDSSTSSKVFLEWYNQHFDSPLFIDEQWYFASLYFAHKGIVMARESKMKNLNEAMKMVNYFPSFIGIIGTDHTQKNNRVMQWITSQIVYEETGVQYRNKIYSPIALQQTNQIIKIPAWEDRSCFPHCSECYNDICKYLTTVFMISILTAFLSFVSISAWVYITFHNVRNVTFYFVISYVAEIIYSILELIGGTIGVISVWSIRETADTTETYYKVIVTTCIVIDTLGAVIRLIVVFSDIFCEKPLLSESAHFVVESVIALSNVTCIVIVMYALSGSSLKTSSSMPVLLDIALNLVEVAIYFLSDMLVNTVIKNIYEEVDVIFSASSLRASRRAFLDGMTITSSSNSSSSTESQ